MPGRASHTLAVKVTPRAGADGVVGWLSDARDELGVRVTAAPEGGKANGAVVKMLARSMGIPKSTIGLVRGHTSRHKLVVFEMDDEGYERWRDSLPVRQ
ncbi:MAG: DUF167 domain-containing protein [Coriobacteriales bacterium]|jgi:uncharacterized protein (TIGR00251 family)|nr:DUF167 domain-containing protein [Coriobacteriales bacterium]